MSAEFTVRHRRRAGHSAFLHRRTASTVDMAEVAARRSREGSASSLREQVVASSMPAPQGADPFDVAMARFLDESGTEKDIKARRHGMFKIIPRIEKGGWVVKQAVGQNTPVLLGKKLTTQYHRSVAPWTSLGFPSAACRSRRGL